MVVSYPFMAWHHLSLSLTCHLLSFCIFIAIILCKQEVRWLALASVTLGHFTLTLFLIASHPSSSSYRSDNIKMSHKPMRCLRNSNGRKKKRERLRRGSADDDDDKGGYRERERGRKSIRESCCVVTAGLSLSLSHSLIYI